MKGYARRVQRVLLVAMALNLAVAIGKLVAGYLANSLSVMGDGLHSSVDALANVVALLVLRLATAPADEDHPYGHSKYETLAAFVLSGMLFLTAFELGKAAVLRLVAPEAVAISGLTFGVMGGTLVVNVVVAWWERREGKRQGSDLLLADAAQTRSDVLVSLGVLVGLGLSLLGFAWLDPVLALVITGFIGYAGWRVFQDALPTLTDKIVFDPVEIARIVREVPGVVNVHDIRSRGPRREAFVQMHLVVDARDVAGSHAIADRVEARVSEELGVKEVFVHIEPEDDASGPPGTRGDAALPRGHGA